MISIETLKFLSVQKVKDAEVLLKNSRNGGAIYMIGYALEFSLKRKISITLGFTNGFPENNTELTSYSAQLAIFHTLNTGIQLTQIRQIRNHRLSDLLLFSGAEGRILANCHQQWQIVRGWNPENRYLRQRITKSKAASYLAAAKRILKEFYNFI